MALKKPLRGKCVVVTRARKQAEPFCALLESYGAEVLLCPVIRIIRPKNFRRLDKAIRQIKSYDWLIFTSVNGVGSFAERWGKLKDKQKLPPKLKTCAIGPATADKMRSLGMAVSIVPKRFVAESILRVIPEVKGKRILIPRVTGARKILPDGLRRKGARVDVVEAYRTVPDGLAFSLFQKRVKQNRVDCITFTSSSTAENFFKLLSRDEQKKIVENPKIAVASIGPVTTGTIKKFGMKPSVVSPHSTTRSMAQAIASFYSRKERKCL